MTAGLNLVPFVSVDAMMKLVLRIGVERFLEELGGNIEEDFLRWERFDKTPRVAAHSAEGVIELMPTSDGRTYGFKYVNGHPKNTREGRQTVTAFGVLADVSTGYPVLLSEMTILTALRTAATSAVAARHLAPKGARTMSLIGNGAQAEFQALAFRALLGVDRLRLYDVDRTAAWASGWWCAARRRKPSRVRRSSPRPPPTSRTPPSSPTTWSGRACTSTRSAETAPARPSCTGTS
jgi:ornithine cyclodeaminase